MNEKKIIFKRSYRRYKRGSIIGEKEKKYCISYFDDIQLNDYWTDVVDTVCTRGFKDAIIIQNAGYDTHILVSPSISTRNINQRLSAKEYVQYNSTYELEQGDNFVIIGTNPIKYSNKSFTQTKVIK